MKKITSILILIPFMFLGCAKEKATVKKTVPKIEIYLPKERIISIDGIKLPNDWNFNESLKNEQFYVELNDYYLKYTRLDSITNNLIYTGNFKAQETDLQEKPFLNDEDILGFNFETSEITISASGHKKLWELQPNMNFSRQFILTANRKPILTGYFFNSFSSSYVRHFYITYVGGHGGLKHPKFKDMKYKIEYNSESRYVWDLEKYDFTKCKEFYNGFKKSGKILVD